MKALFPRAPAALIATSLCLGLQGCIDGPDNPPAPDLNPDPDVCPFLPAETTTWKGGDTWGEELTVSLDPETMAYEVTIDASLQRTQSTVHSGTLEARDQECTYDSDEAGAIFTLAPDGVLQGGVTAPDEIGFLPLLAFQNTFSNPDDPRTFNSIAFIANIVGVHHDGAGALSYGGAGRLRNAGTFQLCRDTDTGRFMEYTPSCSQTEKGYLTWNGERDAFDLFTTDPEGSAVTEGGAITGSAIIGLAGGDTVLLQLVRDSAASFGMRVYTLQEPLASGDADGTFSTLDTGGGNARVTVAGAELNRGEASATLSFDTPVDGVTETDGDVSGHFLYGGGVYGFIPSSGDEPAFELGVLN